MSPIAKKDPLHVAHEVWELTKIFPGLRTDRQERPSLTVRPCGIDVFNCEDLLYDGGDLLLVSARCGPALDPRERKKSRCPLMTKISIFTRACTAVDILEITVGKFPSVFKDEN